MLLDQWRVRGPDFLHKWREFLDEERKEHLGEARKFLLIMGGGSYASAVLYCPELSVDELAANKGMAHEFVCALRMLIIIYNKVLPFCCWPRSAWPIRRLHRMTL